VTGAAVGVGVGRRTPSRCTKTDPTEWHGQSAPDVYPARCQSLLTRRPRHPVRAVRGWVIMVTTHASPSRRYSVYAISPGGGRLPLQGRKRWIWRLRIRRLITSRPESAMPRATRPSWEPLCHPEAVGGGETSEGRDGCKSSAFIKRPRRPQLSLPLTWRGWCCWNS
jgi:hypothetical protein